MANGGGFYATATYRSALRNFNNTNDTATIDPDNRIGFISFYNADAQTRPYIQVGIDPALTTAHTVALLIANRETATGGDAAQFDAVMTRTGATGTFAGKSYNVYRYELNAEQATQLGASGWLFKDDTVVMDLRTAIGASGADINFNPDRVEFTAGTGYAPATDGFAASTRAISAIWTTAYTNTARTTAVGVGGHWNLDMDISDAFEVRMVWGGVPSSNTGRIDEDSRLLIPPFIYNENGSPPFQAGYAGDNYAVRLTFGQYAEFVFSKQSGGGAGVINRITRVANPANANNSAQLYSVQARF